MLSRAAIQRKCAFTYMNAVSRKDLTDARAQLTRTTCASRSTQAPHSAVSPGLAPSRRMIVTCMWGVSDPLRGRAWGEEGGSQVGVAHAPAVDDCDADSSTDQDAGGTERRPGMFAEVAACPRAARSPASPSDRCHGSRIEGELRSTRGTVLPNFRSLTLFPSWLRNASCQWEK